MERNAVILLLTFFLIASCKNEPAFDPVAERAAIDRILKTQEDAYDQNSEAGRKALAATCIDSLLFIGGDDGGVAHTAEFYVHDLADGYTRRPAQRIYRIFPHTAVVSSVQQTFKVFGKDTLLLNSRSVKVFVKEGPDWKMAYVSFVPLPVLYNKTVNLDAGLAMAYSGLYHSGPAAVDTVSWKEGKLYLTQSGSTPAPLIPVSDSSFIGEGYFGRTGFVRSKNGTITEMYYEFIDGQRLHFPRVQ